MRSLRLRTLLALGLATATATATPPPAGAVDHIVDFRCIHDEAGARYEIVPNPVVLAAGSDRVVFRTGAHDDALPCANVTMSPTLQVEIWSDAAAFLWYYDSTTLQGPFCEPGTRSYQVTLRGSHGNINGSFGPGVIEVLDSGGPIVPPTTTIGVYAEDAALTCVLPASPGSHRAYVCARLDGGASGRVSSAEFRVGGFPAGWRVTATPGRAVVAATGDPLGAGAHVSTYNCSPGSSDVVVLYELDYDVTTTPMNEVLEVHAANLPGRNEPRLNLCTGGSVSETCARGGRAYFSGDGAPCVVAVHAATWTRVRSLYR